MKKHFLLLAALLGFALEMTPAAKAQNAGDETVAANAHIKSVTAITEVFGDGQKLTAAAVEYDRPIAAAKLATSSFSVPGRTITRV